MRQTNLQTSRHGFSAIELLVTATVLSIVTAFGLIGITKARAAVRLSGSAREYASYVEKARIASIRSHADAAAERASVDINDDQTSYDVTMDLDGDGGMDTRTITLPSGITFETVESVAFDWRGRTWNTVGGVTSSNAQVSIRLLGDDNSVSIDITGSGDITIDSQVFDDSVPNVNLHVPDLSAGATPVPTPAIEATPSPESGPTPVGGASPEVSPTPELDPVDGATPTPTPVSRPTPPPTATPTPNPHAAPTPTPMPAVCILSADISAVVMKKNATKTIKLSHDADMTLSITGSSSKPSDLQVSPGGAQSVAAGGTTSFTIKAKKVGVYTATFSSDCGTKIVAVTVIL